MIQSVSAVSFTEGQYSALFFPVVSYVCGLCMFCRDSHEDCVMNQGHSEDQTYADSHLCPCQRGLEMHASRQTHLCWPCSCWVCLLGLSVSASNADVQAHVGAVLFHSECSWCMHRAQRSGDHQPSETLPGLVPAVTVSWLHLLYIQPAGSWG